MILHHVAQGSRVFVVASPVPDADLFCHRDRHVVDIASVPDRLEERIGETECQDILNRLLAEVVVDAEYLGFVEALPECSRHFLRGFQVMADRFFHHDAVPRAASFSPASASSFGMIPTIIGGVAR